MSEGKLSEILKISITVNALFYIQITKNAKTRNELTPLHIAIEKRNTDNVKYLVEQCHTYVDDGNTPLHFA